LPTPLRRRRRSPRTPAASPVRQGGSAWAARRTCSSSRATWRATSPHCAARYRCGAGASRCIPTLLVLTPFVEVPTPSPALVEVPEPPGRGPRNHGDLERGPDRGFEGSASASPPQPALVEVPEPPGRGPRNHGDLGRGPGHGFEGSASASPPQPASAPAPRPASAREPRPARGRVRTGSGALASGRRRGPRRCAGGCSAAGPAPSGRRTSSSRRRRRTAAALR